jgi:hypothetical protein
LTGLFKAGSYSDKFNIKDIMTGQPKLRIKSIKKGRKIFTRKDGFAGNMRI